MWTLNYELDLNNGVYWEWYMDLEINLVPMQGFREKPWHN